MSEADLGKSAEELKKVGLDLTQVIQDTHTETMMKARLDFGGSLEYAIKTKMLRNKEVVDEKQFKPFGKLANLDKRIDKAHELGLLDDVAKKDAHLVRKIRNDFAHEGEKRHFDSDEIVALAKDLSTYAAATTNQEAILTASSKVMGQLKSKR